MALKLPLASVVAIPTALSFDWIFVLANWLYALRRAVPAKLPRIPIFAKTPNAPETFTMLSLAAAACGPAIFNPSARSVSVCAEPLAVAVRMSATSVIREDSIPNTRILFAAISAASPRSVPVARERFNTAGIAFSISFGLNPIRPRAVIASATCFAVKDVSRPSFSATAVRDWNSFSVAPVTPLTRRISSSKPAKVFVA